MKRNKRAFDIQQKPVSVSSQHTISAVEGKKKSWPIAKPQIETTNKLISKVLKGVQIVNVYHAGFDDAKSLLDEHGLNQDKEQDQENIR